MSAMKVCIVGASGKLGQYMVQHALDRGYEVVGVCRAKSVSKLEAFKGRITIMPGATNNRAVIKRAVAGCDGVLTVLVPWGVHHYSSGTAQAVLDYARPNARLIFSCGWHITYDGQDVYSPAFKAAVKVGRAIGSAGCAPSTSTIRWKHAGESSPATRGGRSCAAAIWKKARARVCPCGVAMWAIPSLQSNMTRRVDYALFMVEALKNDALIHEAPAIVGCRTPSALAHAATVGSGSAR